MEWFFVAEGVRGGASTRSGSTSASAFRTNGRRRVRAPSTSTSNSSIEPPAVRHRRHAAAERRRRRARDDARVRSVRRRRRVRRRSSRRASTDTFLLSPRSTRAGLADTPERPRTLSRRLSADARGEEIVARAPGAPASCPASKRCWPRCMAQGGFIWRCSPGTTSRRRAVKLRHFGLGGFFEWGVFGEESADRSDAGRASRSTGRARARVPEPSCAACGRHRRHAGRHRVRARGWRAIAGRGDRVVLPSTSSPRPARTSRSSISAIRRRGAQEMLRRMRVRSDSRPCEQRNDHDGPGSERGPVALPVFKIGRCPSGGRLGSTPRRFRQPAGRLEPAGCRATGR